jgi:hypothetical protein
MPRRPEVLFLGLGAKKFDKHPVILTSLFV